MNPVIHYTDADLGDYAEQVLAVLDAQAEFFRTNARRALVDAKTKEAALRKLTLALLDHLGRRKFPAGYQRTMTFGEAPSFGDGGNLPD